MKRTLHATLAEIVREVVKTDDGGFAEMIKMGLTPPPQTMALTSKMRDALVAYDQATDVAGKVPLRSLIEKAHTNLEAGDTAGVSACLSSMLLVLDYDAERGPYAPEVEQVQ